MKDFKHNNVLELIGVALGDHGIPMIVLPLMTNGSLKAHISDVNVKVRVNLNNIVKYWYVLIFIEVKLYYSAINYC